MRDIRPETGQVGAAFVHAGQVLALDVFSSPEALASALPRLARSGLAEATRAMAGSGCSGDAQRRTRHQAADGVRGLVQRMLAQVRSAKATNHDAAGMGTDTRFRGPGVHGHALLWNDTVVHLCAFPEGHRLPAGVAPVALDSTRA